MSSNARRVSMIVKPVATVVRIWTISTQRSRLQHKRAWRRRFSSSSNQGCDKVGIRIRQCSNYISASLRVARVTANLAESNGFMTHVIWRLTAKNRDQLQNPTLGNRVQDTFFKHGLTHGLVWVKISTMITINHNNGRGRAIGRCGCVYDRTLTSEK